MARKTLMLLVVLLSSCQTTQNRLSNAVETNTLASTGVNLPNLPLSCIQHMEKAYPNKNEPWVVTQKRWEILAENKNDQISNCEKWYNSIRDGYSMF